MNLFGLLALALTLVTSFSSCGDDEVLEEKVESWYLNVFVLDKNSVNILNDKEVRAEYMEKVKFIYRDSVFSCKGVTWKESADVLFDGENSLSSVELWMKNNDSNIAHYGFRFGGFALKAGTFQDEKVIIDWGDGDTDEIKFSSVYVDYGETYFVHEYLNGEEISYFDGGVYITKE